MINHEIVLWVACGATAFLGFVLGRMHRVESDYPSGPAPRKVKPVQVETTHPYRDSAAPTDGALPPSSPKKRSRLFAYLTHDKKHVWLCCPACQGVVTEMPVCTCTDVNSDPHVHFHTKCSNCGLRFAMETSVGMETRKRREAEAKAKDEPSKEPPKAN